MNKPAASPAIVSPAVAVEPARGLRSKIVRIPCVIRPVQESPGFEKKELAEFKLDIGGLCEFGCAYCSSNWGNYLRIHREQFADLTEQQLGRRMYPDEDPALTFVWEDVIPKLEKQLGRTRPGWGSGKTLVFSMLTDGFGPNLVANGTTERALRLVLDRTAFRVRALTKNAAVGTTRWIEFFKSFPGRFVVGLSIGSLDDRWARRIELGTSPPSIRISATQALQDAGLPTFGMACPVFPDLLEAAGADTLIESIRPNLVETFWAEPFNDRANWRRVRDGYSEGSPGYDFLTDVYERGNKELWSRYATDLYTRLRTHAERNGWLSKLRFLLYEDLITAADAEGLGDMAGILLQSKPGGDGYSRNPHIANRERALGIVAR